MYPLDSEFIWWIDSAIDASCNESQTSTFRVTGSLRVADVIRMAIHQVRLTAAILLTIILCKARWYWVYKQNMI